MTARLLPGFTILIPVLNSEGRIERCLESIRKQDYPRESVQVIVADGGSTDATKRVARDYGALVVDNPLRLAEEGLRAGMPFVEREYVVIFADDNELPGKTWLSTVAEMFEADDDLSAFFCRLAASPDDPAVNKYYALIESEPLSYAMNRNLGGYLSSARVKRARGVEYRVFQVDPARPLVWGANGLTYRTAVISPIWRTDEYLGDNDAFQVMIESGNNRVAYTRELCVYHHHVTGLWSWRKKWARNFQCHFLTKLETRNLDWLYVPHFEARLVAWTLYSLVPVVSIPVALLRAARDREWHWLYHPAAAFLQAATYIRILLTTREGRAFLRRRASTATRSGGGEQDRERET